MRRKVKRIRLKPIHYFILYVMFVILNLYFGKVEYRTEDGDKYINQTKSVHEKIIDNFAKQKKEEENSKKELMLVTN